MRKITRTIPKRLVNMSASSNESFLNDAHTAPLGRSLTMSPQPYLIELMQTPYPLSLRLTALKVKQDRYGASSIVQNF